MSDVYSFNKVILMGHISKAPVIENIKGGSGKFCKFRVATHEKFTGDKKPRHHYHSIVVFRKKAEFCFKYLRVGMAVLVEGKLRNFYWKEAGQERRITEIELENIMTLGKKYDSQKVEEKVEKKENPFL